MTNKKIVVVDIDGTISEVGERLKYLKQEPKDWDSFYNDCFEDEPIMEMVNLVYNLHVQEYELILCTGRRESCREKTIKWIQKYFDRHFAKDVLLLMRPDDDHRHDSIIKPLLLEMAGVPMDEIAFVLEDRNSMVKKWRELGLRCLQVAEGDF